MSDVTAAAGVRARNFSIVCMSALPVAFLLRFAVLAFFSKDENRKMAQKYQVSWSSLFVVSHKNGKEYSENLTEFAFGNSRSAPDKFKSGLAEKITQALR